MWVMFNQKKKIAKDLKNVQAHYHRYISPKIHNLTQWCFTIISNDPLESVHLHAYTKVSCDWLQINIRTV